MLKDVLLAKQKEINERLETLLISDLSAHQKLFDAMNYSLSAGGKRIRPFLFLLILELWGKDGAAVSGYCLCARMRAYVFPHP